MISLLIRGRLGNQMFQYAAVRAFQQKYYPNEEICIVTRDFKKLGTPEDGFTNSLVNFHTKPFKESEKLHLTFMQWFLMFIARLYRMILLPHFSPDQTERKAYLFEKKMQPVFQKHGLYYMIQGYEDFVPCNVKNKVFVGNFESSKYFDSYRDELLEEYTSLDKPSADNAELYQVIQNTESVCVTIRRGDFVTNETFKKMHYICTPEYFYKGIEKIQEMKPDITIIVFSDDVDWVRENMHFPVRTYYETGHDSLGEKLRLMSACKHFVISNSTFSWWAQYLSRNEHKIVIAPSIWNHFPYKEKSDIYQDGWTLIDVEGDLND